MSEASKRWQKTDRGKTLSSIARKKWQKNNRERYLRSVRKHDLKRKYGITIEQRETLFAEQNFCCAVCKSTHPGIKTGYWSIDHDHKTRKVRGILCTGCNMALGHTKDDPLRLRLLAEYVEKWRCAHDRD